MSRLKLYISVLLTFLLFGCSRLQPVLNVEDTPVAYDLQNKQVKAAIVQSATNRGWTIKEMSPNVLIAKLRVRSHMAEVKIPYTNKYYSIIYLNSENLKADDGKIHHNYNRWVNNLNVDIQRAIALWGVESQK
ncbi:lipoprotein [Vibrio zhanjiangensis]|uniref:Lipoprotein n=1 Tax=Vibrio zhanjiangensis TaxID=1046128 RepID=A0ABQ6F0F7_9VIBR|nr:hypothetical protein [Vibrio zhanjiangensis]GLT18737.1 lipoprotein [Vibrio zhanjiangensis]